MLSIYLFLVNILTVFFGIYLFDYQVDGVVNNVFVILLSIIVGFIATFVALIIFLEVTHLLFAKGKPNDSKMKRYIARQIVGVPLHLFGVRSKVIGLENLPGDSKFLIYSNHTSEFDVSIIMRKIPMYPVAFLAKKAVMSYLSIGKWAAAIGCIMLDRENNRKGLTAISQVVLSVQNGSTMAIFPEGKINRELGILTKFRRGSFKIALGSSVPVLPITLVKDKNYNSKRLFSKKFTMVIHKPIPFEEIKTMNSTELSEKVYTIINTALIK